jgi:MoaA/NifB/PqqE/SkfB family radical SAM enzyme
MDFSIISKTVNDAVKHGLMEIIPSTMGEPLLYKNFIKIIELCRERNIKLNITTNGTWPGLGPEKWAELICPVTSDIKISWNGAVKTTQEAIMKGSLFEKRLKNLQKFIAVRDKIGISSPNRCRVTLQCTFLETNVDELPDLVKMAAEMRVDRVKGHHLWVHFPEIGDLDMRRSKKSIEKWNKVVDRCNIAAQFVEGGSSKAVILENFNKINEDTPGMMPSDWECPFLGKEAWVNYKGDFNPCCAPDAERMKLGYFGNVIEEGGISSIWNGTRYRSLVANYKSNEICKKCNMRKPL